MNTVHKYIYPRIPEVAQLMAEEPFRRDFGGADLPTLAALIFFAIAFGNDHRETIVSYVRDISFFDEAQIAFMIDQYEGRKPRRHLWWCDEAGRYDLLK